MGVQSSANRDRNAVPVPHRGAYACTRAITWSAGTVLTDLIPVRRDGVPLGYDTRWLYPVLPTTAVSDATTSI